MIEVCCAIIVKEFKILAVQRGPQSNHPWKWEFPGGKINPLETAEQCIVREIEEELMIRLGISEPLLTVEYDYGKGQLRLIPFVCKVLSGEIKLMEHADLQWFALEEWETLDWLDADRDLILKNRERLKLLLS